MSTLIFIPSGSPGGSGTTLLLADILAGGIAITQPTDISFKRGSYTALHKIGRYEPTIRPKRGQP